MLRILGKIFRFLFSFVPLPLSLWVMFPWWVLAIGSILLGKVTYDLAIDVYDGAQKAEAALAIPLPPAVPLEQARPIGPFNELHAKIHPIENAKLLTLDAPVLDFHAVLLNADEYGRPTAMLLDVSDELVGSFLENPADPKIVNGFRKSIDQLTDKQEKALRADYELAEGFFIIDPYEGSRAEGLRSVKTDWDILIIAGGILIANTLAAWVKFYRSRKQSFSMPKVKRVRKTQVDQRQRQSDPFAQSPIVQVKPLSERLLGRADKR